MTNNLCNDNKEISILQNKYSSAPYSFLQSTNLRTEARRFLNNELIKPDFNYTNYFTEEYQLKRLMKINSDLNRYSTNDLAQVFLKKRQTETELVLSLIRSHYDTNQIENIIKINSKLYEEPSVELFSECLAYLEQRSYVTKTQENFSSIMLKVGTLPSFRLPRSPSESVFSNTKKDFYEMFPGYIKVVASVDDSKISKNFVLQLLSNALEDTGAKSSGWIVREIEYGANVRVSAHKKQVIVGKYFRPRSSLRLKQVVAHEIYCHVQRLIRSEKVDKLLPAEEEGIAIVCEQIIAETFSYKRMLRYIAVSLGWGVDGVKNRSFNEVYEILWRCFMIISGCAEHVAKDRAFYETARAFRGSNPEGGTVITKDCIYFISNLRVWKQISENPNEYSIKKLLMV